MNKKVHFVLVPQFLWVYFVDRCVLFLGRNMWISVSLLEHLEIKVGLNIYRASESPWGLQKYCILSPTPRLEHYVHLTTNYLDIFLKNHKSEMYWKHICCPCLLKRVFSDFASAKHKTAFPGDRGNQKSGFIFSFLLTVVMKVSYLFTWIRSFYCPE